MHTAIPHIYFVRRLVTSILLGVLCLNKHFLAWTSRFVRTDPLNPRKGDPQNTYLSARLLRFSSSDMTTGVPNRSARRIFFSRSVAPATVVAAGVGFCAGVEEAALGAASPVAVASCAGAAVSAVLELWDAITDGGRARRGARGLVMTTRRCCSSVSFFPLSFLDLRCGRSRLGNGAFGLGEDTWANAVVCGLFDPYRPCWFRGQASRGL